MSMSKKKLIAAACLYKKGFKLSPVGTKGGMFIAKDQTMFQTENDTTRKH